MKSEELIKIFIPFIGVLLGAIIAGIFSRISNKKAVVSAARIDWVQKVRGQLAEVIVSYNRMKNQVEKKPIMEISEKLSLDVIKEKFNKDFKDYNLAVKDIEKEFLYMLEVLSLYFPLPKSTEDKAKKYRKFYASLYKKYSKVKDWLSNFTPELPDTTHEEIIELITNISKKDSYNDSEIYQLREIVSSYLKREWDRAKKYKK